MKLFITIILCFLFLTGCSEPQEHSPPQPTTNATTVQQQQQQEEDASTDAAVQTSIDMMMSVATQ